MATKMGMRRTIPQLPLKRKTPLRAKKGLNKMSENAKKEMKIWLAIKAQRMAQLREEFGYVPCEKCLRKTDTGSDLRYPEAHHNDGNRRHNFPENCRIVCRLDNQRIKDKNIKDVPSLL